MNNSYHLALHINVFNNFFKYPLKMMEFAHNSTP